MKIVTPTHASIAAAGLVAISFAAGSLTTFYASSARQSASRPVAAIDSTAVPLPQPLPQPLSVDPAVPDLSSSPPPVQLPGPIAPVNLKPQNTPLPPKMPDARVMTVLQSSDEDSMPLTAVARLAEIRAKTNPETKVTLQKAGIASIETGSVRFNSGVIVAVGKVFPSGERLLSADPVTGRIVTDQRNINLTITE